MDTICLITVFYGSLLSNIYISHTFGSIQVAIMGQTDTCDIRNTTMTCQDIPITVPGYVRNVIVRFHRGTLSKQFLGDGWGNVESLDITGDARYLSNGDLRGLENIRDMSLCMKWMKQVTSGVFSDTPRIEKLSLLKMNTFDFGKLLIAVTQHGVSENLTELKFDPNKDDQNLPNVNILNNAVNRLVQRPFTTLQISNSYIHIKAMAAGKLVLKVQQLNVSGSLLWIDESDGLLALNLNYKNNMPLFKTLDVSGARLPYRLLQQIGNNIFIQNVFLKSEHVYADNMWSKDTLNLPNNISNTKIFLKSLYCRKNTFKEIRGRLLLNKNNPIKLVDLSENQISFMQPVLFSTAVKLKILVLSRNKLSEMQLMPEFPELTDPLRNLERLYLDANSISSIPWNMFTNNKRLEILNIADNKLSTIAFDLSILKVLKTLDVSKNCIHFIEGDNLVNLAAFVQDRHGNKSVNIKFQGNPLQCSCKSLAFIQWLHFNKTSAITTPYKCKYEGASIAVDHSAVSKCKFLCRRTFIIAGSIIATVVFITLIGIVIYACIRVKRRNLAKDRAYNFIHAFANNLLPYDHGCFLAFAGKDEEIVQDSLLNPLDKILKEKLATNKEVMCTGSNFKPGYPIYDEAYRLIKHSCVFVAVVSDAFCESKYCRGEIREACTQHKSVIVVLLETVAEDKMSPYLAEVFRRNARAKMAEREDGHRELVPNVKVIAESVFALAINGIEK